MTPTAAYKLINKIIWGGRLPKAKVVFMNKEIVPRCYGVTLRDEIFILPLIVLNSRYRRWGKTLIHEMIHVAEPSLRHGELFERLVELHWRQARPELKKRISREK